MRLGHRSDRSERHGRHDERGLGHHELRHGSARARRARAPPARARALPAPCTTSSGTSELQQRERHRAGDASTTPTFAEVLAMPLSHCSGFEPPCHNGGTGGLMFTPAEPGGRVGCVRERDGDLSWAPASASSPATRRTSFLYRKLTDDLGAERPTPRCRSPGACSVGCGKSFRRPTSRWSDAGFSAAQRTTDARPLARRDSSALTKFSNETPPPPWTRPRHHDKGGPWRRRRQPIRVLRLMVVLVVPRR